MWLLDVNLPVALFRVLADLGITAETTIKRGWRELENGALVSVAVPAGFTAILTRDVEFAKSAAKALVHFPQFAVVIVKIEQRKEKDFIQAFLASWRNAPIQPKPGTTITWPEQ